jgi:hypothetical protein
MSELSYVDFYKLNVIIPVITFILGFFASRFTLSKKERRDIEQTQYENSKQLMESQNDRFQEFASALSRYIAKEDPPTLDDFFQISTVGERYFYQQKITSDAILSGIVDPKSRDNTLVPKIVETIEKSLPAFYNVLQIIAKKKNFPYAGKLERKTYESLYLVAEKYGKTSDLLLSAQKTRKMNSYAL